MNLPGPIQSELDRLGARNAAREITRAEAVTALRDAIIREADRAFLLSLAAEFAGRQLDAWHRARRAAGFPAVAGQSELFPDLPARLYVRPGVLRPVALMDGHDWDMAWNMLHTRAEGAINAAEADLAAFDGAYDKVRPLLTGDLTTADVLGGLGDGAAATP
jgi:hypothetical protein